MHPALPISVSTQLTIPLLHSLYWPCHCSACIVCLCVCPAASLLYVLVSLQPTPPKTLLFVCTPPPPSHSSQEPGQSRCTHVLHSNASLHLSFLFPSSLLHPPIPSFSQSPSLLSPSRLHPPSSLSLPFFHLSPSPKLFLPLPTTTSPSTSPPPRPPSLPPQF